MKVASGTLIVLWDAKNLQFTNSEGANQYVKPQFRKGWKLKV